MKYFYEYLGRLAACLDRFLSLLEVPGASVDCSEGMDIMGGGVSNDLGLNREGVVILDPPVPEGGGVSEGEASLLLIQLLKDVDSLLVLPIIRSLFSPLVNV